MIGSAMPGAFSAAAANGVVDHLVHVRVAAEAADVGTLAVGDVLRGLAQLVGLRGGDLVVALGLVDHRARDVGRLLCDRVADVVEHRADVGVGEVDAGRREARARAGRALGGVRGLSAAGVAGALEERSPPPLLPPPAASDIPATVSAASTASPSICFALLRIEAPSVRGVPPIQAAHP